ncbi:M14 family zinc carboxypeptidase [Croceibacter atlanticus]|uniref:M14 family zinc carboxypeptidase n=1 Tax=Croceibacter atlanticus TaxID=313588 RepID=UPI0030F8AF03
MRSILLLVLFTSITLQAQKNQLSLNYYLPEDVTYNTAIPTPEDVLGYVPGTWHVSHDKLVSYMKVLAKASDRIHIEQQGLTYEDRPLLLLTITSPENHNRLEAIRQDHLALTETASERLNTNELPVVVYQGFSIHGNEPSGSNAALVAAYYLAAAQGPKINELLKHTVILFDPSLNPDGLQRFAYWANTNKSKHINTDPQDREYDEVWPGGRTNHYWFDMNRDWLPVQLPESRARIATFHKWHPNILTDHHEMGSNSSFFFQPGIPSRTHPLTPALNQELTKNIGNYHAKALDNIGSLYYTEEDYDDFYYGKGSTFPDINGSIGILFEQASSRGHAQETDNGVLTFPFTIRNQFTAALSTLEAAVGMRTELLDYQRDFYKTARSKSTKGSYVFGNEKDAASAYHLAEILKRHNIDVYELKENFSKNDKTFKKAHSYVVPKNQRQQRLLEAMFETRTTFQDSLFYDISAWTFPLAFNLDFIEEASTSHLGRKIDSLEMPKGVVTKSNYGYLMQWHHYYAPKALQQLLDKDLRAKVAMKPFSLNGKDYDYGTIFIPVQNQELNSTELFTFLSDVSKKSHLTLTGVPTGLTEGIDLGSRQFKPISKTKVALLVGEGITPYDAGEIWHLFDTRYAMNITKLDVKNFNRYDLSTYTDIILPNSWGRALAPKDAQHLKDWVKDGGTLIGFKNAARFFNSEKFMSIKFKRVEDTASNISFEDRNNYFGAKGIGGAIFEAKQDRSHPINFGYKNTTIPLFRNSTIFIEADKDSYNNPLQYTKSPLLSGYINDKNLDALAETVPFKHNRLGSGHVILFTDNTNFRAFWYGTNKLLMNAIFFGNHM